jgi:transposase
MENIRKRYTAQEKARIVLEILKGGLTQSQLTAKYGVHNTQLHTWKKQAIEAITAGFSDKRKHESRDQNELIEELYKQIGRLKVELDWLKKKSELFR